MTAIAGYLSLNGRPAGPLCARMLEAQAAFGRKSARIDDGPISLGRNLYPILPEDRFDTRPLKRGSFALVADLRLDNRAELSDLLGFSPLLAARKPDSELLFEALLKWGKKAVDRLVGEFAFAFWNSADQSLLLGRDLFGHRPLFFHRSQEFVAFATMPSGLHALNEIARELDVEFVAEQVALFPHVGRRTWFKNIERVEPAQLLCVDRSRLAETRYWEPPRIFCRAKSSAEYEEGLRSVVDVAVQAQLRGAQGEVASQLSSGLDSSIVTTTAARLFAPNRIIAFTAVPRSGFAGPIPRGTIGNEAEYAAQTAALYPNIEHVLVENQSESPFAGLDRGFFYYHQPMGELCNVGWGRAINRLAKARGLKILMVGFCGNSSVSYSGMEYLPWLLRQGRVLRALNMARSVSAYGVPLRTVAAQMIGPFLPAPLWRLACSIYGRPTDFNAYSALNPAMNPAIEQAAKAMGHDLLYKPSSDPIACRTAMLFDGDPGNYYKAVLAEYGLSLRDPLSDRRVVEFCLSVPPEEYIKDGIPRSLARRSFADRLPPAVAKLASRGQQAVDWYEAIERNFSQLQEEVEKIARCGAAAAVLDIEGLKEAIATWPSEGWSDPQIAFRYRYRLMRAVAAGHFIRKVEGTN